MKDSIVQVSKRWCDEVKRNSQRFILVNLLAHKMLEDMPPDKKAHWLEQLRGIDTRRKLLYDCPQVTQTDNRTIPST